nr:TetR/AcrR family transcriptional regulator [Propioniciclava sinopodophylli]
MSTTAPAHRPSARAGVLASTLALARTGASVSLVSAARAAGITKAGLMYHFPTKEALMTAVVDHLLDGYERDLAARLTTTNSNVPTISERLAAYVDWACDGPFDYGDLVMLTDPRLREPLTERWNSRMGAWVDVPETLPADQRARLHGVRLLADGIWLNTAGNGIALSDEDTDAIRALAHHLIQENS